MRMAPSGVEISVPILLAAPPRLKASSIDKTGLLDRSSLCI
jgi:hypothetical protein